ncbi:hypothetical protein MMC10_007915 [Thelotrema lepadinum]|nr:hypothetical protein [Thelotrema lepadinum]
MFFATGIILHRVMSFDNSPAWSRNFALGLSAALVVIAVYHCYAIETIVHQSTFVVMVHAVAWKTRSLINGRVSNKALKGRLKELAMQGTTVYIYFALVEQLTEHGSIETNLEKSEAYAWPVSSRLKHFKEA